MKKFAKIITLASLALPLAFATPLAANAAATTPTTKAATKAASQQYSLAKGATFYKKAQTYHTRDTAPVVYKAAFAADSSNFTLTKAGKLKSSTTYKVTRKIVSAATKTQKSHTFFYVKGHGWVLSPYLTKGAFHMAD